MSKHDRIAGLRLAGFTIGEIADAVQESRLAVLQVLIAQRLVLDVGSGRARLGKPDESAMEDVVAEAAE